MRQTSSLALRTSRGTGSCHLLPLKRKRQSKSVGAPWAVSGVNYIQTTHLISHRSQKKVAEYNCTSFAYAKAKEIP